METEAENRVGHSTSTEMTTNHRNPKCQKCLETGHWTYECKGKRKTLLGDTRSKILKQRIVEDDKGALKVVAPPPPPSVVENATSGTSDSERDDSDSSTERRRKKKKKQKKKERKQKRKDKKKRKKSGKVEESD